MTIMAYRASQGLLDQSVLDDLDILSLLVINISYYAKPF